MLWAMRYLSLILLLLSAASTGAETGYRYVHPDGSVEFSDEPIPGGDEIELHQVPTTEFTPVTPSNNNRSGQPASARKRSQEADPAGRITITSPGDDQTVWFDAAGMTVGVALSPPPGLGQVISITLDGKPVASGTGSSFNIGEVYRGTHTLRAELVGENGSVIISSSPVTFHMRQHSLYKRVPPESPPPPPTGPEPILP